MVAVCNLTVKSNIEALAGLISVNVSLSADGIDGRSLRIVTKTEHATFRLTEGVGHEVRCGLLSGNSVSRYCCSRCFFRGYVLLSFFFVCFILLIFLLVAFFFFVFFLILLHVFFLSGLYSLSSGSRYIFNKGGVLSQGKGNACMLAIKRKNTDQFGKLFTHSVLILHGVHHVTVVIAGKRQSVTICSFLKLLLSKRIDRVVLREEVCLRDILYAGDKQGDSSGRLGCRQRNCGVSQIFHLGVFCGPVSICSNLTHIETDRGRACFRRIATHIIACLGCAFYNKVCLLRCIILRGNLPYGNGGLV